MSRARVRTHRDPAGDKALGRLSRDRGWIERNRQARAIAAALDQLRATRGGANA